MGLLGALVALAVALVCTMGSYRPGAWSQSPVSPLATLPLPWDERTAAVSPLPVSPSEPPLVDRVLDSPVWLSPLPWVGVGVVFFGLLAWALYTLFSRRQAKPR